MNEWAHVDDDGKLCIDWETIFEQSIDYDAGANDYDAQLAKLITLIQKFSFERGYEAGIRAKHPVENLLCLTMGNA